MVNINIAPKILDYTIKKPINFIAKSKVVNNFTEHFGNDNVKFIAGVSISSILLKEGYGCYLYVKNSLNNKQLSDEKRKSAAALDLVYGTLLIATQLLAFKTVSNKKFQDKIFGKLFSKKFDMAAQEKLKMILKRSKEFEKITDKDFQANFNEYKQNIREVFGILTSLAASTIIARRIIVPFTASLISEDVKKEAEKFNKNKQNKV